jgi:very-short-patch-repair endonuclease
LDARDVTLIDAIPVTNATRTVLDLGVVLSVDDLMVCFDDAARRGLTSWLRLSTELERFGDRRPGSRTVRRVLSLRAPTDPVPESVLESKFDTLLRNAGLPSPSRQHVIVDQVGRFVARVDFAFVDRRVAVEIDSVKHHAGTAQWRTDLSRQNRIMTLGWRVLRFTAHDLEHRPHEVATAIADALDLRRASLEPE